MAGAAEGGGAGLLRDLDARARLGLGREDGAASGHGVVDDDAGILGVAVAATVGAAAAAAAAAAFSRRTANALRRGADMVVDDRKKT